jgi:ABC-type branched-subunit amino acid transport system ATPase component
MPAAAVEVQGLRKTYGSLRAVDGLDLTVTAGECVVGFVIAVRFFRWTPRGSV